MDITEAKARLGAVLNELAEDGFSVWGWDGESIQVAQANGPSAACAPRHPADDPCGWRVPDQAGQGHREAE